MPEQKNKIEVGIGRKAEKPGPGKEAKKTKKPEPDEVGGRAIELVICPNCHMPCPISTSSSIPVDLYECWNCGKWFLY